MTTTREWVLEAACRGVDTALFYDKHRVAAARRVCAGCPVRPECLHSCLTTETDHTRWGIWGGLTVAERRALSRRGPKLLAAVREHLASLPTQDTEGTPEPMTDTTTDTATDAAAEAEKLPAGKLLAWGDAHLDTRVQEQSARARLELAGLRQRYTAEQELARISTEAEQLEQRLAALQARKAELAPAKAKKPRKPVDYPSAEVRAWAKANGHECSPIGRVPKGIVDAWREATGAKS